MRIVHVTLGLAMGGQERLLVEFARHADRARFDLAFIALGQRGPLADVVEDCGWPVTALNEPAGIRPGLVMRLASALRRLGPEVVHTHDDRPLLYGGLAARLAGAPRCLHTHHHGVLPSVSSRQQRLVNWAARLVDPFICVSHDSARQMIHQGVPAGRVQVLWNGIDVDRFAFAGPAPDGPAVTVARLSPEKDLATLIRAAAQVVARDPSFRLEIAGDGPCRDELQHLTHTSRLNDHVRFLGEIRDVPALLARARLFVLPSLTEGISLTLLEAMARGLPVVTTQVGGNPEVVDNGRTGLLVPSATPTVLAEAIAKLWHDPARAEAMGRAGRQRVESEFDVRNMVRRYETLYEHGPAVATTAARVTRLEEAPCAS